MITVEKAISLVLETVTPTSKTTTISLEKALGYVVAQDIKAPISLPPFRQSAMDGYAIHYKNNNNFTVVGETKAGDASNYQLLEGEAIRIFTGAPVTDTANAVIKQELVSKQGNTITIDDTIKLGSNIRPIGEQIKKDTLALKEGVGITASTIGFLAGLGIQEITVYAKPTVAIVVTGNELATVGQPLQAGQVYESNAIMLQNALASLGIRTVDIHKVIDDYDATHQLLSKALDIYDFTLVSGGISVGDYDFVGKALQNIGVNEVFYKVKQKPGKPLYFGHKDHRFVFALPGNPASALSCFYVYVALALAKYSRKEASPVRRQELVCENSFAKNDTRAQFLKAFVNVSQNQTETVKILEGQASSMLKSFAVANALVYLPEGVNTIHQGDSVNVLLLPN